MSGNSKSKFRIFRSREKVISSTPIFQIWLCGGSVLVAPCSRVGHVFRMRRPYQSKAGLDTNMHNSVRAVRVWFDEYQVGFSYFTWLTFTVDVSALGTKLLYCGCHHQYQQKPIGNSAEGRRARDGEIQQILLGADVDALACEIENASSICCWVGCRWCNVWKTFQQAINGVQMIQALSVVRWIRKFWEMEGEEIL